ncbi:hypothetical protein BU26DRAFT_305857 [Trematosphaeria pertusa]|uniref:Uncharacterized protein n=1 Tax=Trematosphaeria pertusa TaxID=390896 RepID=A0A6A6IEG0_9PLEO|nr:uncharacterized protein BU26DRAFT_305857 [Trematosphaeria pertusa]KAF2248791.1 hypothetical protein BU26DRAFT_305857 [Trematosphaeria pertusa]
MAISVTIHAGGAQDLKLKRADTPVFGAMRSKLNPRAASFIPGALSHPPMSPMTLRAYLHPTKNSLVYKNKTGLTSLDATAPPFIPKYALPNYNIDPRDPFYNQLLKVQLQRGTLQDPNYDPNLPVYDGFASRSGSGYGLSSRSGSGYGFTPRSGSGYGLSSSSGPGYGFTSSSDPEYGYGFDYDHEYDDDIGAYGAANGGYGHGHGYGGGGMCGCSPTMYAPGLGQPAWSIAPQHFEGYETEMHHEDGKDGKAKKKGKNNKSKKARKPWKEGWD